MVTGYSPKAKPLMKSIYFLSFNMISFVPYAFGLLKSFAEQDTS